AFAWPSNAGAQIGGVVAPRCIGVPRHTPPMIGLAPASPCGHFPIESLFRSGAFTSPNGGVKPPLHQIDPLPTNASLRKLFTRLTRAGLSSRPVAGCPIPRLGRRLCSSTMLGVNTAIADALAGSEWLPASRDEG